MDPSTFPKRLSSFLSISPVERRRVTTFSSCAGRWGKLSWN